MLTERETYKSLWPSFPSDLEDNGHYCVESIILSISTVVFLSRCLNLSVHSGDLADPTCMAIHFISFGF